MASIKNTLEINKSISIKIYFNEILTILLIFTLLYYGFGFLKVFDSQSLFVKVSNILIIIVSVIGVVPVLFTAVSALIKKTVTVELLASIALVFTLLQGEWVSAVFINLMLTSARLFSAFTERKTEDIISRLLKLRPTVVRVQDGEDVKEKKLEEVLVGDVVLVESGDRIPIDGVVIKGQASVDQSTLTGESEPLSKGVESKVFSSTLCLSGSLFVRAEKVGEDTTLSKMIKLVDEASRAKTKTETLANRFSAWYIFVTLVGVVVIYLLTQNLNLILSILLVTCADDLAVAIPLGFTVAISKAAKHGIVIKGASVMEKIKDIKVFVTDKTGTLTKGIAVVNKVVPTNGYTEKDCVEAGMFASADSKHPTALAIIEYIKKGNTKISVPDEVREFPGEGVWAKHGNKEYFDGKVSFLQKNGVDFSKSDLDLIQNEQNKGFSVNLLAIDKKLVGFFVLSDQIKKYAKEVVNETRSLGVEKWVMLTGDNEQVASRVTKEIGVDEFYAGLKPEEKLEHIKDLKKTYGNIAMMGDGVNDAASLALADVSFAMGAIGSDVSVEASDITLMKDDLRRVPEAIFLSNESIKIVKQNFIIWGLSNGLGLWLVFSGLLGPVGASAYNFLTDFIPILNVFKIYNLKINKHTYDKK